MWSGQWPGPEPAGLGRAWASNMPIVLRAGPGHTFCGPGPGLIIQFAGRARAGTTAAGPGRAWASNHICGPGLGLNFRPVQGPEPYTNLISSPSPRRSSVPIPPVRSPSRLSMACSRSSPTDAAAPASTGCCRHPPGGR